MDNAYFTQAISIAHYESTAAIPVDKIPSNERVLDYINSLPPTYSEVRMLKGKSMDNLSQCHYRSTDNLMDTINDTAIEGKKGVSKFKKIFTSLSTKCYKKAPTGYDNLEVRDKSVKAMVYSPSSSGKGPSMLQMYCKSASKVMYQKYLGQVYLTILTSTDDINITVSDLKDVLKRKDDYCLRASLVGKRKVKTTEFKEQFTMSVSKKDYKKRLLISVCKIQSGSKSVIGCMSFLVKNLMKKRTDVNGWYYLLTENIGYEKHMKAEVIEDDNIESVSVIAQQQVQQQQHHSMADSGFDQSRTLPESEPSTTLSEVRTIPVPYLIKRCSVTLHKQAHESYGFALMGRNPAMISTIAHGLPADRCGIQPGDYVHKVNGEPVYEKSAEEVGILIRNYPYEVHLDMLRCPKNEVATYKNDDTYQTSDSEYESDSDSD